MNAIQLTPKKVQDRLHQLSCERRGLQESYLRANGWDYSSSNILCQWFWQKKLEDGRTVMVNADNALEFQRAFDQSSIDAETEPSEIY